MYCSGTLYSVGHPHPIRVLVPVLAALLLIHLCGNVPGRQQIRAPVLERLPPTWDTQIKFLILGFGLPSLGCSKYLGSELVDGRVNLLAHSLSLTLFQVFG